MYQFSRSIYRSLAPRVLEEETDAGGGGRQCVHDACEAAILRLANDHRYFPRPARSLFLEVRHHFALGDQLWAYQVINTHMQLALEYIANLPPTTDPFGEVRRCPAFTRRGKPCQRVPLDGREYCPSHKHLETAFGIETDPSPRQELVPAY